MTMARADLDEHHLATVEIADVGPGRAGATVLEGERRRHIRGDYGTRVARDGCQVGVADRSWWRRGRAEGSGWTPACRAPREVTISRVIV